MVFLPILGLFNRMAAAAPFAGDQRRCGSDQPHAEQQQRMKQVDGERARRDSLRPQAAQQQKIRRGNRRPGDIARDHRQREGDKRGGFDAPGGGVDECHVFAPRGYGLRSP